MHITLPKIEKILENSKIEYEIWPCDEKYADTNAFCLHYNVAPENSVNAILVQDKKNFSNHVLCLVTALDKLDVNGIIRRRLKAKKATFVSAEETKKLTGMEIGGVTPVGLPDQISIWVDAKIMKLKYIILGGGNRTSKLKIDPIFFNTLKQVTIVDGLSKK